MTLVPPGERDLRRLLAGMAPVLDPITYSFCLAPSSGATRDLPVVARVHEAEGETLVLPEAAARAAGLAPVFLARRITLTVHSDLEAVGFLAAIAARLTRRGIPVNPVAGIHHDHLFVPLDRAEAAMTALQALAAGARGPAGAAVQYAVRISLEAAAAEEWRDWMTAVHLPDVMATGCFETATMVEELEPPPPAGRRVFQMEYLAVSLERLQEYQARFAPALQQAHTARYAGRFEASRSIRRVAHVLP